MRACEAAKRRDTSRYGLGSERYECYSKPTAPAEEDQSKLKPGMPITFALTLEEQDASSDEYTPLDIPDIFD